MTPREQILSVLPEGLAGPDVPMDGLEAFAQLVRRWNPAINLVAKSTVADLWSRHIVDSAQLMRFVPNAAKLWLDVGSGGGFPALVCAILAKAPMPETQFVLVESDQRKATFLREAARQLGLGSIRVLSERVEALAPLAADVMTARALAPLAELCGLAAMHLGPTGHAVFLKGRQSEEEVRVARQGWKFALDCHPSATSADSSVLVLKEIRHV